MFAGENETEDNEDLTCRNTIKMPGVNRYNYHLHTKQSYELKGATTRYLRYEDV